MVRLMVQFTSQQHIMDLDLIKRYKKIAAPHSNTLQALAMGHHIGSEACTQALFFAMRCATTSGGQAARRRLDAEAIERLWVEMHRQIGIDVTVGSEPHQFIDPTDPTAVEQWLDEGVPHG